MVEISDYLTGLEEQVVQEEKEIEVIENPFVDKLCSEFEDVMSKIVPHNYQYSDVYWVSMHHLEGIYFQLNDRYVEFIYSAENIRDFSIELKKYEDISKYTGKFLFYPDVGLFLSAAVNACKETDFEVITEHLSEPLHFLGSRNKKNLTVKGNAGENAGEYMEDGVLTIKGNVGDNCGRLMKGGKIVIEGNTGKELGGDSEGGEIHVSGKIEGIDTYCKAKIYRRGKLVWPKWYKTFFAKIKEEIRWKLCN